MNPVLNVAVRDVIESIKTKRLLVTLFIFVFIGIGTAHWVRYLLMSSPTGDEQFIKDAMANSFLNNLRNFLALLSILFGADAINREIETGTIRVTLGHPIYRDQFLIGKFLGKGAHGYGGPHTVRCDKRCINASNRDSDRRRGSDAHTETTTLLRTLLTRLCVPWSSAISAGKKVFNLNTPGPPTGVVP